MFIVIFFFSSRRRHTRSKRDWSSDVCSSDLEQRLEPRLELLVEVVDEDGARGGHRCDIGCGRLVQLAITSRYDDRLYVEVTAADIGEHVSDDTERRDDRDAVRR